MVAKGHIVRVVAPHAQGAAFTESNGSLSVRRYAYMFPFALQQLCYDGGMLIRLKANRWTGLLIPFLLVAQIYRVFVECALWKPDVIHSHSLLPQGWVCAIAARVFSIPHVSTSHGNDVFGLKSSGLMGAMKRWTIRRADRLTVNSLATRQRLLELVPSAESRTSLIPAAPNVGRRDDARVAEIKERYAGKRRLLFVGRLIEEKGVFDLLAAVEQFFKEHTDWELLVVGEGAARGEMERRIAAKKLSKRVHLLGWRPREEVPSWMAACDLLVVPSRPVGTWQEAQGLVVVEAMAVGTPVIAAQLGGLSDMVIDGETGWLFEPRNDKQLHEKLKVFAAFESSEAMTRRAKLHYETNYSPDCVSLATDHVYRQFLDSTSRSASG
jgi:glycosyltransferase involved in cell wall biosynthesis